MASTIKNVKNIFQSLGQNIIGDPKGMDILIDHIAKHANEDERLKSNEIKIEKFTGGNFSIIDSAKLSTSDLKKDKNVDLSITDKDAANIFNEILKVMTDPNAVALLLKPLDDELGNLMAKNDIIFQDNDLPLYLMNGGGAYIPGPPPDSYQPKKKLTLLDDKILLPFEKNNGINLEGLPIFAGVVNKENADALISSGYTFKEEKQIAGLLLHGSFSHRLLFYALCQLNLTYDNGKRLLPKQLLSLLVRSQYYPDKYFFFKGNKSYSMWDLIFDRVADTKNTFDPKDYNFNCRDPFVFNSLLLCFGKELNLPNLQHYLLDSHWKVGYSMAAKVKDADTTNKLVGVPNSKIYSSCMEAMVSAVSMSGEVGHDLPFTLNSDARPDESKYQLFSQNSDPKIVKKISPPALEEKSPPYKSWDDYMDIKKRKR